MWYLSHIEEIIYDPVNAERLWYEKFCIGLLDHIFVVSKMDPGLFMSKTTLFMWHKWMVVYFGNVFNPILIKY